MRNLQALDATESNGQERASDGAASSGELRARKAVGVLPAARELPEARGGNGAGADGSARVARKGGSVKGKAKPQLNHVLLAMLVDELMDGGARPQDLADVTGLGVQTINKILRSFHKRGVVHVCGWEKDAQGRMVIRVFALGRQKDAPKPTTRRALINRAYRERRAANAARALSSTAMQAGAA